MTRSKGATTTTLSNCSEATVPSVRSEKTDRDYSSHLWTINTGSEPDERTFNKALKHSDEFEIEYAQDMAHKGKSTI